MCICTTILQLLVFSARFCHGINAEMLFFLKFSAAVLCVSALSAFSSFCFFREKDENAESAETQRTAAEKNTTLSFLLLVVLSFHFWLRLRRARFICG